MGHRQTSGWTRAFVVMLAAMAVGMPVAWAQTPEPIKIGFSVSLTGGLASSGKAHLMSKQIWLEEINAKGGLLGRPVKLVYYDDQTNAATLPGIYAKLLDVDKVDLLMGHATNLIVAAMPIIIERKKLVMVLLALGSNAEFKYSRYFQSAAFGPDSKGVLSDNFFEVAKTPQAGAEDGGAGRRRRRVLQQRADRRARQRQEIRPAHRLRPQLSAGDRRLHADRARHPGHRSGRGPGRVLSAGFGRHRAGRHRGRPEDAAVRRGDGRDAIRPLMQQLGDKVNRVVNYHLYVPSPKMNFPGIETFLKKYQAQAKEAGTDPLGFYQPPFAYAAMQVLEQAIKATGSLNDDKLADYIHKNAFNTIVGEIRFNELGEWATARMLVVQFQKVQGSGLEQYMTGHRQVIVHPPQYKDGELDAPFAK